MNQRLVTGTVAVLAGMAFNFLGDWLLGARIEIFRGIDYLASSIHDGRLTFTHERNFHERAWIR